MRTFRGINLKLVPPALIPVIRPLAEWTAPASRAFSRSIERANNPQAITPTPSTTPPQPNPVTEFLDSQFRVNNAGVNSRKLAFSSVLIPNNTTVTLTSPAASGTIALLSDITSLTAPIGAKYITQTPDASLTNEQALSLLSTGILKSTTGTGVLSIAIGTDLPAHATQHQPGGADAMAVDAAAATGSLRTLGSGAAQACAGNDSRLSDSRTPTAHATTHKSGGSDPIKLDEFAAPTDITTLNASASAHGLLPKLANSVLKFLRDDGTWQPLSNSNVDLTGQNASIATTNIVGSTSLAGMYRVTAYLKVTTAGAAADTLSITIGWIDGVGLSNAIMMDFDQMLGAPTTLCNLGTINQTYNGIISFYCTASTAITYATNLTKTGNPVYTLRLRLEYVG